MSVLGSGEEIYYEGKRDALRLAAKVCRDMAQGARDTAEAMGFPVNQLAVELLEAAAQTIESTPL